MRRWLGVLCVLAMAAASAFGLASAQQAPKRVALIIANATYAGYAPLNNPAADARLVEAALKRAGFAAVTVKTDLGSAAMRAELGRFQSQANGAELALIYYAGHGVEVGGKNYLIPTDASLATDAELDFQAVDADLLTRAASGARARVIVLDACRENPFLGKMRRLTTRTTRSGGQGLAAPLGEGVRGTLLMYSARPGELAQDGPVGGNSPFASAFARFLPEPGVELRLIAGQIADAVSDETGNEQLPFTSSSLSGAPIYLVAGGPDSEAERLRRQLSEAEARAKRAEAAAKAAPPRPVQVLTVLGGAVTLKAGDAFAISGVPMQISFTGGSFWLEHLNDNADASALVLYKPVPNAPDAALCASLRDPEWKAVLRPGAFYCFKRGADGSGAGYVTTLSAGATSAETVGIRVVYFTAGTSPSPGDFAGPRGGVEVGLVPRGERLAEPDGRAVAAELFRSLYARRGAVRGDERLHRA